MKNKLIESLDNLIVATISVALLAVGAVDISKLPEQKSYQDQYMSFVFPGDYFAVPTAYEGLTIVEIKNDQKKFADIARIELADGSNESLEAVLKSSYSDFLSKQIKKVYKGSSEGYQFAQSTANESVIYTYIKENNSIYMIKFYESYYDSNNPLVKMSNALILKDFYKLVNSFSIV